MRVKRWRWSVDTKIMPDLTIEVFGDTIELGGPSPLAAKIPRITLEHFCLRDAWLGDEKENPFIAAIATDYPSLINSRSLVAAIGNIDPKPVVICLETIDSGLRNTYHREGISFASEDGNAYLPFLKIQQAPASTRRKPEPLSPQAQRIVLNLIAGRWDGYSASALAELTKRSRASVTKYLKEIEAICPPLLKASWRVRALGTPRYSKDELLDIFEPYLKSPIKKVIRLSHLPAIDELKPLQPKLTGMSALPFFSDLAHDASRMTIMMDQEDIATLQAQTGSTWRETAWNEEPAFVIEEWTYPLDDASDRSIAATGLACVDPFSLYAELINDEHDDPRIHDAIDQLREQLCQQ